MFDVARRGGLFDFPVEVERDLVADKAGRRSPNSDPSYPQSAARAALGYPAKAGSTLGSHLSPTPLGPGGAAMQSPRP